MKYVIQKGLLHISLKRLPQKVLHSASSSHLDAYCQISDVGAVTEMIVTRLLRSNKMILRLSRTIF